MLLLFAAAAFTWLLYKLWVNAYKMWERRGIPQLPGYFPSGTTDFQNSLGRRYVGDVLEKIYKQGEGHPYIGFYDVRLPMLLIRDPEIIRLVLAKEFSCFRDRHGMDMPKNDILAQHLFNLEGERWRALRVKMSPTFTSGKIKAMFPLFINCAETLNTLIIENIDKGVDSIEIKDLSARFTTDIICSCAFGLEVDSMRQSESEFREIGSSFFKATYSLLFFVYLIKIAPQTMDLLKMRFTPRYMENFIMKVVRETVEYRQKNKVKRNDFLDLLMDLKNVGPLSDDFTDENGEVHTTSVEMTMELMAAQCFVFFLAGYETSSSVQTFCLYELALNPEIQAKVQKEIDDVIAKHGELTYEAIMEMQYLDMVVHETMRKYPTLPFLTRRCSKSFTMPDGNRIEKGDRVAIPVWSLHHDPQYFPKPEMFDPERFSSERKSSIKPFSYLPFGEGPRICIGMRFGLLQTKVGIITVLRKYKVEPSEKTPIPLTFCGGIIISLPKEKVYLKISKRS